MPAAPAAIPTSISYAHDDAEDLAILRRYLNPVFQGHGLDVWEDGHLAGGQVWSDEIAKAISRARVFVLVLTPSFLVSPYVLTQELPAIRAAWDSPTVLVLPIVLKSCFWRHVVAPLQIIPTDNSRRVRAIHSWRRREDGLLRAAEQVDKALEVHLGKPASPLIDWSARGALP